MSAKIHIFKIKLTCSECIGNEVQHIEGTIADILSEIHDAGWPICPDCGWDMEESVVG